MKKLLSLILSGAIIASSSCVSALAADFSTELEIIPKWDERTVTEQFVSFKNGDSEYVSTGKAVTGDFIGEKTGDIKLTGYDIYEDKTHYADAESFAVNTISYDCAAAVKFQDDEAYYIYKSYNYFPDTLGSLIDGLDLENTVSFGSMYLSSGKEIKDYDRELIKNLLLENRDSKYGGESAYNPKKINFSINVDLIGIKNKSLSVTEDGYINTNIMEWGYSFYIGEAAAAALADSLGVKFDSSAVPCVEPEMLAQLNGIRDQLKQFESNVNTILYKEGFSKFIIFTCFDRETEKKVNQYIADNGINKDLVIVDCAVPEDITLVTMTTAGYVPDDDTSTTVKNTGSDDLVIMTTAGYIPEDNTVTSAAEIPASDKADPEKTKALKAIYEQLKQFEDENSKLIYNEGISDRIIFTSDDIFTIFKVNNYIAENGIDESLVSAEKLAMALGILDPYETVKKYIERNEFKGCTIFRNDNGKVQVSCDYKHEEEYKKIMNYVYSYSDLINAVEVYLLESCPETVIKGDVSGDGKVSVSDAVMLQKYLTKKISKVSEAADINNDNKINVFDYVSLSHMILK